LFRGVEITTGGQRIHNYEDLVKGLEKKGLDPEKFEFYLQALNMECQLMEGLEWIGRLTAKLLGIKNIKEATYFLGNK